MCAAKVGFPWELGWAQARGRGRGRGRGEEVRGEPPAPPRLEEPAAVLRACGRDASQMSPGGGVPFRGPRTLGWLWNAVEEERQGLPAQTGPPLPPLPRPGPE